MIFIDQCEHNQSVPQYKIQNMDVKNTTPYGSIDVLNRDQYWTEVKKCGKVLALEGEDQVTYGSYSDPKQAIDETVDDLLYPHRWFVYHASSATTHGAVIAYGGAEFSHEKSEDVINPSDPLSKVACDIAWQQFRADCVRVAKSELNSSE